MRKSTVGGLWLAGLAGIAAGIAGIAIGAVLMLAYGGTYGGAGRDEFQPALNPFFWWMVALITAGVVAVAAGGVAQFVAWIGALVNTYALADRTWFVVLLITGVVALIGFAIAGFVAMAVYLLIGPDSRAPAGTGTTAARPPVTLAPAS